MSKRDKDYAIGTILFNTDNYTMGELLEMDDCKLRSICGQVEEIIWGGDAE